MSTASDSSESNYMTRFMGAQAPLNLIWAPLKITELLLYFFPLKIILYFNYFASLYVRDGTNTHATGSNGFIWTGLMYFE